MASREIISLEGVDNDSVKKDTMTTFSSVKDDISVPNTVPGPAEHSVNYIIEDVPDALAEKTSTSDGIGCSSLTEDEAKLHFVEDTTCEDVEDVKDNSCSNQSMKDISQDIIYSSMTMSTSGETPHVAEETKDFISKDSSHKDVEDANHLPLKIVEVNYEGKRMTLCSSHDAHMTEHSMVEVAKDDNIAANKQVEAVICIRENVDTAQTSDSSSRLSESNLVMDVERESKPFFEGTTITISSGEDFHSELRLDAARESDDVSERQDSCAKDVYPPMDKKNDVGDLELSKHIEGAKTSKPCGMVDSRSESVITAEKILEKQTVHIHVEGDNVSQAVKMVETSKCLRPCAENLPLEDTLARTSNDVTIEIQARLSQQELKRTTIQSDENVQVENLLILCSESNQLNESNEQNLAPPMEKTLEKQDKASNGCDVSLPQSDDTLHKTDVTSIVSSLQVDDKLAEVEDNMPIDKNNNATDIVSKKQTNNDEKIPRGESSHLDTKSKRNPGKFIYEETDGEELSNELEEDNSVERKGKPCNKTEAFEIGDLVWAKVKSHPWWPAQIFDPTSASKSAMKVRKDGRFLLAFFGDCTFAWLKNSQLIPFKANFEEMAKQTTMKSFCKALDEALEEVCRRSVLNLTSKYDAGILYCKSTIPDANAGFQKPVGIRNQPNISLNVHIFEPVKTLEYLKSVACTPFGTWNSSLESAELRGHVYGLRTFMVPSEICFEDEKMQDSLSVTKTPKTNRKRRFSSLESSGDDSIEVKNIRSNTIVSYQTREILKIASGDSLRDGIEEFSSCTDFEVKKCKKFMSLESSEQVKKVDAIKSKGNDGMQKLRGIKMDSRNKRKKNSTFDDGKKKVSGELTGSLPLAKCVDKASSKRMKTTSKKHLFSTPSKDISLAQLHEGLYVSARDPLNSSGLNLLQDRVIEGILRFRTKVFKESTEDSREKPKKAVVHPKQGGVSPKKRAGYHHVSYRNDRADIQGLTIAAHKRKSEIVQDSVKKKVKTSLTPQSNETNDFESFINSKNPVEPRRFDKDIIKYSRRPAPSSELKRPVQVNNDEKLSSRMPLGLFMKFPRDFKLPSESELEDKFLSFGPLDSWGTKVDTDSASAQVAFKHGSDAELAWKHAKQNSLFGHVDVNYRLRYISSPQSSMIETKTGTPSNKDECTTVMKPISLTANEVKASSSKHLINNEDQKMTLLSTPMETRGLSAKCLSKTEDNKNNDSMSTGDDNDLLKSKEHTGDIQDQMMTLLRQVSVIVGTPDTTEGIK